MERSYQAQGKKYLSLYSHYIHIIIEHDLHICTYIEARKTCGMQNLPALKVIIYACSLTFLSSTYLRIHFQLVKSISVSFHISKTVVDYLRTPHLCLLNITKESPQNACRQVHTN